MTKPALGKQAKVQEDSALKGTLVSVFFVGFFIIFTWLGVFFLFLSR